MGVATQILDYTTFDHPPTLIQFFEGSDLQAWENSFSNQCDEIEQMFFDILTQTWLDTGVGQQLDNLGAILGLPRNGLDDATYGVLLRLQAQINRSAGTPDAIIEAFTTVLQAIGVTYLPLYGAGFPATFAMYTSSELGIGTSYDLVDSSGDTIVDSAGDTIEVGIFTELPISLITQLVPAGVQVDIADELEDNLGNLIVDSSGDDIMVLTVAAAT